MVVELYELVAEHFLRISIIEGLHSFKTAIPRQKKQALRSKVTALSEKKKQWQIRNKQRRQWTKVSSSAQSGTKSAKNSQRDMTKTALGGIAVITGTASNVSP